MPLREEDIKPITATPEWQLARELADPRVGKTEREHYAARRIADLEERIAWMTMRGTDELPRNDLEGNRIREELTGNALVEYLRAQRRAERDRAEMAERERDAVTVALTHVVMAHGVRFDRGTGDSEECSCEACKEAKRVLGPAAVAKLKGGAC